MNGQGNVDMRFGMLFDRDASFETGNTGYVRRTLNYGYLQRGYEAI